MVTLETITTEEIISKKYRNFKSNGERSNFLLIIQTMKISEKIPTE